MIQKLTPFPSIFLSHLWIIRLVLTLSVAQQSAIFLYGKPSHASETWVSIHERINPSTKPGTVGHAYMQKMIVYIDARSIVRRNGMAYVNTVTCWEGADGRVGCKSGRGPEPSDMSNIIATRYNCVAKTYSTTGNPTMRPLSSSDRDDRFGDLSIFREICG